MATQKLADAASKVSGQLQRQKGAKNFYDVAFLLSNYGVGTRFIRNIWWNKPETYWTVTRFVPLLKGKEKEHRRGKAYGVLTFKGKTDGKEQRIRGALKKGWRYVPEDAKLVHWPLGHRKDVDMNHPRYPQELKEKYYDVV